VAVQVLIWDKGKQKPGAFGQIGRGQGAGYMRIGICQHPGQHHEANSDNHPRLDQAEDCAHEPVKPTKQGDAHDLFQ